MSKFTASFSKGILSEVLMHNHLAIPAGCVCLKALRAWKMLSVCQRPVVAWGLLFEEQARWSGCCSPERRQFRGQLRLFGGNSVCGRRVLMCVLCLLMHNADVWACVGVCSCTKHKMDPSGRAFSGQVPVDGERKGREMMMRVGGGWPMGSSRDGAAC